jgi:hypothetical protein
MLFNQFLQLAQRVFQSLNGGPIMMGATLRNLHFPMPYLLRQERFEVIYNQFVVSHVILSIRNPASSPA